jgi:hypothetical protein
MANDVIRDVAHRYQDFFNFKICMRLHGKGVHIIIYMPKCTSSPAPISRNSRMFRNFVCWLRILNFVKFVRMTSEFRTDTHLRCHVKFDFHYVAAVKTRSRSIIVTENCCTEFYVWEKYLGQGGTSWQGRGDKLHNGELNDLYCSPNIVRLITSRIIRWA